MAMAQNKILVTVDGLDVNVDVEQGLARISGNGLTWTGHAARFGEVYVYGRPCGPDPYVLFGEDGMKRVLAAVNA
jgi:hypothetical protein